MYSRREGVGVAVVVLIVVIVVLVVSTVAIATLNAAATASSSSSQSTLTMTTTTTSSSTSGIWSTTTSTVSSATSMTTGIEAGNSTYVESQYGLELQLSINAVQVPAGGTIQVNVTELNTLNQENNVTKSGGYAVPVVINSCPNTNVLPLGIAVYKGHYTAQNVSLGNQVPIFPPTVCPMYERLVTGYLFQ